MRVRSGLQAGIPVGFSMTHAEAAGLKVVDDAAGFSSEAHVGLLRVGQGIPTLVKAKVGLGDRQGPMRRKLKIFQQVRRGPGWSWGGGKQAEQPECERAGPAFP